jgi:FAD/FMN-containing dehydrogenase
MRVCGWGRYPFIENAKVFLPQTRSAYARLINNNQSMITRGLGRSYGDSANNAVIIESNYFNHFIDFDDATGVLICESGVSIREILALVVPRGWFIPVTPGTSFVTIGGAIASDIHGKNHHMSGSFSKYVLSIDLMLGTGEVVKVSSVHLPDLFRATCGGMGLTGAILSASIQLKPIQSSFIQQTTIQAKCLEEVCELFEENFSSPYSVAWIDCLSKGKELGRSLLMLGEHEKDGGLEFGNSKALNIQADMPTGLLNYYSIKAFNALYYHKVLFNKQVVTLPLSSFFYPLDKILNWNRLYGKEGFVQYQFVLPRDVGVNGLRKILTEIITSGKGSFLAVLKIFGSANENYLSFPIEGYALALDLKLTPEVINLINRLDVLVSDMGGRIYLAKDALMSEAFFKKSYPQWEQFEIVRHKYGAIGKFASQQSQRLGLG